MNAAPPETALAPAPGPGFWRRVGGGLAVAARAAGRGVAAACGAVDPDARWHLAQLPLLGLTMLAPRRPAVVARPDDGRRPLVLVHGLGGHPGNFLPMQTWLRAGGRRRHHACGLSGSVDEQVVALRAFVAEVARAYALSDHDQVDVVAHSLGGLVARCAVEDPATAGRVATLVTLGTPHAGSHAARWLATEVHLALRPGSPLLTRLAARPPGPTRLVCFWSRADVLLLPATTATVEGADNREVEGATHYGFLLRPDVWRRVVAALDR